MKWFISDISLLSAQFLLLGTRYFYRSIFFQSFPFYWPYTIISFLLLYFLSYCYFDFTFSLLLFHFCLYWFCCLFFIFIFFSTYYKPHFNLWSDFYCVCGRGWNSQKRIIKSANQLRHGFWTQRRPTRLPFLLYTLYSSCIYI